MKRIAGKKLRKRTKIVALSHGIYHGKLRTVVNRENKIVKIISVSLSFETQIISSSNHLKSISHLIFPDRWLTKKNWGRTPREREAADDRC